MDKYSLTHVAGEVLLRDAAVGNSQDCETIATRLAQLAEIDAQALSSPSLQLDVRVLPGRELHLSETSAAKRIQRRGTARTFLCCSKPSPTAPAPERRAACSHHIGCDERSTI
jgi:hypothetical protein